MRSAKSEIPEWLALTYSRDGRERRRALFALCPCELKSHSEVWRRVLQMADDSDANVRSASIHVLCDGSPAKYRDEIIRTLEGCYNDPTAKSGE